MARLAAAATVEPSTRTARGICGLDTSICTPLPTGSFRASVRVELLYVALVIPFVIDPFGLPGGIRLAVATAALGVALLVARPRYAAR